MSLPSVPSDNRYRIFLLEDSEAIAANLRTLLEGAGFEFHVADDPDFVGWAEINPHLIIVEFQSPYIDALGFCRQIRQDQTGACSGVPVLILGPADDVTEVNALKAGADDYFAEPLRPTVVMARVVTHLRRAYKYNGAAPAQASGQGNGDTAVHGGREKSTPAPVSRAQSTGSGARSEGLPDFIGDIPLWQEENDEALPLGWAECTLCGQRGPSEEFETEDLMGRRIVQCPNPACRSLEHVMFSIG